MTAQLPSRERLEKIASWREMYGAGHNVMLSAEEAESLARFALAAHEQEPYGYVYASKDGGALNFDYKLPRIPYRWDITPVSIHPAPFPAVQDNWKGQLTGTECTPKSVSQVSTGTSVGVAPVPAVPDFDTWFKREFHPDKTGPYVKDQMRFCWNACRAAMLNGGKS